MPSKICANLVFYFVKSTKKSDKCCLARTPQIERACLSFDRRFQK